MHFLKTPQPVHFLQRLLSSTAISFDGSSCVAVKGKVSSRMLRETAECLCENGLKRGEIWIRGDGKFRFSDDIPPELHQRLRNILTQF
jgi:hypothetical protein